MFVLYGVLLCVCFLCLCECFVLMCLCALFVIYGVIVYGVFFVFAVVCDCVLLLINQCEFVCEVLCDDVYCCFCGCVLKWVYGFCCGIWFDVVWLMFVRVCLFAVFCVMAVFCLCSNV